MKNKQILLTEYSYIFVGENDDGKHRAVDEKTFQEVENFVLRNSDFVQFLKIGQNKKHKFIKAQNYVGVIQTKNGTTIEILPKIRDSLPKITDLDEGKSREVLIKMLKTLRKSPFKNFNMANLKNVKMPLLEIFISMFLDELSKVIQKGIRSNYIDKEENLKFLKGKLKIAEQIKQNSTHKERFFVEYQEFSSNIPENRLIKSALKYLYNKSKSNKNQQRIREFLFVFDEIKVSHNLKIDFEKVKKLDRQKKHYENILIWARIFLFQNSFSPYKGKTIAFALLYDMNFLFESYVYHYLKKALNQKGKNITAQDRRHHLANLKSTDEPKFLLKPDIVINNGEIIADTKWKLLNESDSKHRVAEADIYQLYAYGSTYENCKDIYLIYPFNGPDNGNSYDFKGRKLSLNISFFNLAKDELEIQGDSALKDLLINAS